MSYKKRPLWPSKDLQSHLDLIGVLPVERCIIAFGFLCSRGLSSWSHLVHYITLARVIDHPQAEIIVWPDFSDRLMIDLQ